MGKLLFWVAVIAVAYLAYKLSIVSRRKSEWAARRGADRDAGARGEPMRQCAHCGVHLPASETLSGGGRDYCCDEHRDAGPAR